MNKWFGFFYAIGMILLMVGVIAIPILITKAIVTSDMPLWLKIFLLK